MKKTKKNEVLLFIRQEKNEKNEKNLIESNTKKAKF
jgi:hypothetical protein